MRLSNVPSLCALCLVSTWLTASSNASAQHYYANYVASVSSNANNGAYIETWTSILHATCNILEHDMVNHEFWYDVVGSGAYWVETGFKDGANYSGGCSSQVFFWADNRNGGGYNEHLSVDNWAALGDWESFQVLASGSCSWGVYWDGGLVGTSTSNCPGTGRLLIAGIESTSQTSGSVQGWTANWYEEDSNNLSYAQWDNAYLCQNQGNISVCTSGNPKIQSVWSGTGTEEVLNESF